MVNPNDKRVIKTRNLILSTFQEMIIEMEYDEITIKELAERANINRKTFYAHFECIEDLLNELADMIADKFLSNLEKVGVLKNPTIELFVEAINLTLDENFELYKKLVVANSYRFFSRNIKNVIKSQLTSVAVAERFTCSPVELDLCAEFISSGIAKIYKLWLEDDRGIPQSRLAYLTGKLVFDGFNSLFIK
ncbi:MAG: TetR/AcrR family transcriptional regulator [Clostridia bacterium]|nr:TetR/AcrR family transcriptional regulator [Clostridia bacterium]